MSGPSTSLYTAVSLLAGIGIPIMAALNATLGARMENPIAAGTLLLCVGASLSALFLAFSGSMPRTVFGAAPPVYYFGGFFVAFYVLSITWIAPRFGIGNAVFFVLLGQLLAATVIDHFGLFGARLSPVDTKRMAGLAFMSLGVLLARSPS